MQTVAPSDSKGPCKRTQHLQKCWRLHAAFVCTTHRTLLHVFSVLLLSCCAKFETGQTFKKATPNIVPLSPKRRATMLVLTLFGVVGYQFITLCLGGTITVTLLSERKHGEVDAQTQNFKGRFNTILSQDMGLL